MKKIYLILLFLIISIFLPVRAFCSSFGEIDLKIGVDTRQKYKLEISGETGRDKPETAFSMSSEFKYRISDIFKLGVGSEYLLPREEFSFLPVYMVFQFDWLNSNDGSSLFLKANAGYNIIYEDDKRFTGQRKGGMYFGAGVGGVLKSGFLMELVYGVYNGSGKEKESGKYGNYDVTVHKLTLQFGYKIKL